MLLSLLISRSILSDSERRKSSRASRERAQDNTRATRLSSLISELCERSEREIIISKLSKWANGVLKIVGFYPTDAGSQLLLLDEYHLST